MRAESERRSSKYAMINNSVCSISVSCPLFAINGVYTFDNYTIPFLLLSLDVRIGSEAKAVVGACIASARGVSFNSFLRSRVPFALPPSTHHFVFAARSFTGCDSFRQSTAAADMIYRRFCFCFFALRFHRMRSEKP